MNQVVDQFLYLEPQLNRICAVIIATENWQKVQLLIDYTFIQLAQ